MKAIQFEQSIPRYVVSKVLGSIYGPAFFRFYSCINMRDVAAPKLPTSYGPG